MMYSGRLIEPKVDMNKFLTPGGENFLKVVTPIVEKMKKLHEEGLIFTDLERDRASKSTPYSVVAARDKKCAFVGCTNYRAVGKKKHTKYCSDPKCKERRRKLQSKNYYQNATKKTEQI